MDTTAKSLVGAADNDQRSLALALNGLGLGALEDSVGSLTVLAGLVHGLLRAGELGRGDDFHGLGDLLNVLDGLEAALDLAKGGVAGGIVDGKGGGPVEMSFG